MTPKQDATETMRCGDPIQYIASLHELSVCVPVDRRRVSTTTLLESLARGEQRAVDERCHREHSSDDGARPGSASSARCIVRGARGGRTK